MNCIYLTLMVIGVAVLGVWLVYETLGFVPAMLLVVWLLVFCLYGADSVGR